MLNRSIVFFLGHFPVGLVDRGDVTKGVGFVHRRIGQNARTNGSGLKEYSFHMEETEKDRKGPEAKGRQQVKDSLHRKN